jgi:hypothetical protein
MWQVDPRAVHPLMHSIVTGVRANDLHSAVKVASCYIHPGYNPEIQTHSSPVKKMIFSAWSFKVN